MAVLFFTKNLILKCIASGKQILRESIEKLTQLSDGFKGKIAKNNHGFKKKKKKKKNGKTNESEHRALVPCSKTKQRLVFIQETVSSSCFLDSVQLVLCARQILWFQLLWKAFPTYMYIALSHLFTSKKANFKFRDDVAQLQVDYVERS